MNEVSTFEKVRYLFSRKQKKRLVFLLVLIFMGMLFEMGSLGLLIPTLSIILNANLSVEYPILAPFLEFIGNPNQVQLIFGSMAFLVLFFMTKALFLGFLSYKQNILTNFLSAELSEELFSLYLRHPYSFHLKRNSAQLLRNIQDEIGMLTGVTQSLIFLLLDGSILLGIAVTLLFVEPAGAVVVTTMMVSAALLFHRTLKDRLYAWGTKRQNLTGQVKQSLLQGLGGMKDVKLFGRESFFVNSYKVNNQKLAYINSINTTVSQFPRLYLEFLSVASMASLVVILIFQSKSLEMIIPIIGLFVAAAFRLIPTTNRLISSINSIQYSKPVINLLFDEFRNARKLHSSSNKEVESDMKFDRDILVNDLEFAYEKNSSWCIKKLNLAIQKGEAVGFVGHSGSGKTTLIDVVLGLLQPTRGKILVDGKDIQNNLRGWQNLIGYVPQFIYLTDDTLKNNIAFGIPDVEINEESILKALKISQLNDFVQTLPEGINTVVGERGVRLSGGQRQRVGIARALYHNPEVLVFDEATSSLDNKTEAEVMKSIDSLFGLKTVIIVAHRLSTVEKCDRIYQLEHGAIAKEEHKEVLCAPPC